MSREVARSVRCEFEITNRDDGRVIDLTVHGDVSAADLVDVERRLLRVIAVRQPTRLNLNIRSTTLRMSPDGLARAHEAMADVGGVLLLTSDVDPPETRLT
jgi:hypothetical protein